MSDDPLRLDEDRNAPPDAVAALNLARRDGPGDARLLAIETALLARVTAPPRGGGDGGGNAASGEGPSAPPVGASRPGGTTAGALSKAAIAVLAAGGVIVALVLAARPVQDAPVMTVPVPISAVSPSLVPTPVPTAAEAGPSSISVDDLPSALPGATASTRIPARERLPASNDVAKTPPDTNDDPATIERAEVALLADAQAVLAQQPAESLARCEDHSRRFPRGTLVQEREVLAIDALVRLNRRAEAEARANRFRAAFPRSGHLRRIDALLSPP